MTKTKTKVGFRGFTKPIDVEVPAGDPAPWDADARLRVVGARAARREARAKVAAAARFAADRAGAALFARVLVAPFAPVVVTALDARVVARAPGVRAVHAFKKIGDEISFAGDPILAVAADTDEQAEEALLLAAAAIKYERRQPATTINDTRRPDAPQVLPDGARRRGQREGDAVAARTAVEEAPAFLEAIYETWPQAAGWAEPQAAHATPGGAIAPVEVTARGTGGGDAAAAAAALARIAGKPVLARLSRAADLALGGGRPASLHHLRAGIAKDGAIAGLVVEGWVSAGTVEVAGPAAPPLYDLGKYAREERHPATHAPPATPASGPGTLHGVFALESFLDECAHAVGVDPLALRRKLCKDELCLAEWELGARLIGWDRRARDPGAGSGVRKRGLGMASTWGGGLGQPGAEVVLVADAARGVRLSIGAPDAGVGLPTQLAAIVAEELGLAPEAIEFDAGVPRQPVELPDHRLALASFGPAARQAAYVLGGRLREAAARRWGVMVDEVRLDGGRVAARGQSLAFGEACALLGGDATVTGRSSAPYAAFHGKTRGCQFAEVEVDIETGELRVIKIVAVQDAGRVVNPTLAETQLAGQVMEGLSRALFEQRVIDRHTGGHLSGDLLSYRIAGPMDAPEIVAIPFDVANAGNSVGVLGLGDAAVLPTAAAIGNAIFNATGIRMRTLPMARDRLARAVAVARRAGPRPS